MREVTLILKADDPGLRTNGTLYREPDGTTVATNVQLGNALGWKGSLEAGKYRYLFNAGGGSGKYTLHVEGSGYGPQQQNYQLPPDEANVSYAFEVAE